MGHREDRRAAAAATIQRVLQAGFLAAGLCVLLPLGGCTTVGAKPEASVGDVPSKGPVGRTIKANSGKFAACARDSVTVQTGTTQHMNLRFTVDGNGHVIKARVDEMSEPDPDLHLCVLRIVKKLEFPAPGDGLPKELTYPLVLRPE